MEIPVDDVRPLMRQHGPALLQVPVDIVRGQQNGRSEGDGTADGVADPHAPIGGPGFAYRRGGSGNAPRQAQADRQPQQQQAGNAGVERRYDGEPIDRGVAIGVRRDGYVRLQRERDTQRLRCWRIIQWMIGEP